MNGAHIGARDADLAPHQGPRVGVVLPTGRQEAFARPQPAESHRRRRRQLGQFRELARQLVSLSRQLGQIARKSVLAARDFEGALMPPARLSGKCPELGRQQLRALVAAGEPGALFGKPVRQFR